MVTIQENLKARNMDVTRRGLIIDSDLHVATFLLYNLSGQIVGYQQYNPNADKTKRNDSNGRYFTFTGAEGDRTRKIAVWGMDTIELNTQIVFVTEGIFDANRIHRAGFAAIAVLSNNSRAIRPFLRALGRLTVAIMDRDTASTLMGSLTDHAVAVPVPYHDLDDMPQDEVNEFITQILKNLGISASYR